MKSNSQRNDSQFGIKFLGLLMLSSICGIAANAAGYAYGTAGCGLGSVIFKDQPGFIQIVAATVNGTSTNQSLGLTSGTLNCVQSGREEASLFITLNQEALKKDLARGEGESLQHLASLLKCPSTDIVTNSLRDHMGEVFNSVSGSEQTTKAIQNILSNDPAVIAACKSIG